MGAPPDFRRNFLAMPRDVLRELVSRPVDLAVYAVLCDRAAWFAGPREIKGRMIDLDIGQCVCGRPDLAAATGASDRAIRTALNRLQNDQRIKLEPSKQGTKVTICGLKESRLPREIDRPTLAEPTVQRTDQPCPQGPSNAPTSNQDPEDQRSLPGARAIPGSTADTAPTTTGAEDLEAQAIAAGVDVADERAALTERPDWNADAPPLSRWRVWLRRAIKHRTEHHLSTGDSTRRPARSVQSAPSEGEARRREIAEERQRERERAALTPPSDERRRWLAEDLAKIADSLGDDVQEGAA